MCNLDQHKFITGSDYVARTSSVRFTVGEIIKFIPFHARNDSRFEFVESLTIRAQLPDKRGSCRTRVSILDGCKLLIYFVKQGVVCIFINHSFITQFTKKI